MTPGGPISVFAAFHPPSMRSHLQGIPMPTCLFHPIQRSILPRRYS